MLLFDCFYCKCIASRVCFSYVYKEKKRKFSHYITINLNYPHFHFVCDLHFSHSCLAAEYMLGFSGFSSLFCIFYEIYVKVDLFSDSAL